MGQGRLLNEKRRTGKDSYFAEYVTKEGGVVDMVDGWRMRRGVDSALVFYFYDISVKTIA